jgi:hypothetical protein
VVVKSLSYQLVLKIVLVDSLLPNVNCIGFGCLQSGLHSLSQFESELVVDWAKRGCWAPVTLWSMNCSCSLTVKFSDLQHLPSWVFKEWCVKSDGTLGWLPMLPAASTLPFIAKWFQVSWLKRLLVIIIANLGCLNQSLAEPIRQQGLTSWTTRKLRKTSLQVLFRLIFERTMEFAKPTVWTLISKLWTLFNNVSLLISDIPRLLLKLENSGMGVNKPDSVRHTYTFHANYMHPSNDTWTNIQMYVNACFCM